MKQFGLAERMMQWAGFHLLHSGTYDIATVTPCRRARWLGILVHHESLPHINMQLLHTYAWPRIPCTARNFEAIRCMTASESLQFEPSVAEATMYFASDFMPGTHRIWSKKTDPGLPNPKPGWENPNLHGALWSAAPFETISTFQQRIVWPFSQEWNIIPILVPI